ncbi:tetratricopeptide repeat protein [Pannonibacter sp. P2PFMT1]|uniref:tetratricopeptide repeat protein n=2 Tax=Pannonibacter TaxID=227873 RepID=UPI00164795DE|nr:tetratricopeptide repeat protein [Pannonibacter sp. P2PFMT1]
MISPLNSLIRVGRAPCSLRMRIAICLIGLLSPVFAVMQSDDAASQPFPADNLAARQQQLLQATLAQPQNLDIAFEYAMVSSQLGDYEAAIGTLERMLIYAPGLPRVQLELGVLYMRLGAKDMARNYFESAISGPNVPPQVTERVNYFLAAITDQEAPAQMSGVLTAGVRGQSNANAAPGGRIVNLNGTAFTLDDAGTGKADINAFLSANVRFSYDLANQGDRLEADLIFYGARYGDISRLDTEMAEITLGPSLNLARFGVEDARLGLYGIANGIRLDGANYAGGLGAGLRLAANLSERAGLSARAELRRSWYNDTSKQPNLSDRAGYALRVSAGYQYRLTGTFTARITLLGDVVTASKAYKSNTDGGVALGGTYRFAAPLNLSTAPWFVDVEGGYLHRSYDAPDRLINRNKAQRDNEGWLRTVLTMPLGEGKTAVSLTGELRRQQSNYDLNDYTNASGMLSVMRRF